MNAGLLAWIGFNAFILALLAVDLGVFHRRAHNVSAREAAAWTAVWVTFGLGFGALVWQFGGRTAGLEYLTGYLIEKALSVDNIFVIVLIFSYFRVPGRYQHRVLFWGILGALVMRGTMIGAGAYLIHHFHWVVYVFGGLLVLTAVRTALDHAAAPTHRGLALLAFIKRHVPVCEEQDGARFFVRATAGPRAGRISATPLFLVLITIEASDLIFAVDSIPAIFAVTRDPFIVYTSNAFAILGLRSLYFLLADMLPRFRLLKPALAVVLAFVGIKMLVSGVVEIPLAVSLGVIAGVLLIGVMLSTLLPSNAVGEAPQTAPPSRGSTRRG